MTEIKQRLLLDDRKELMLSGISNVDSFDEQAIELNSNMGGIQIGGDGLKIASLNLDEGKVTISGTITSIVYAKTREEKTMRHKSKNALSRLLR